jgi:hypothetical protein
LQAIVAAIPEQGAGELQEREVVACVLLIADQQAAAFAEPGQRPFDNPSTLPIKRN